MLLRITLLLMLVPLGVEAGTWAAINLKGSAELARANPIWNGREVIVYGSDETSSLGARYDVDTNEWKAISKEGYVPSRYLSDASGVWTGESLIVWGGESSEFHNQGFIYDPKLNNWKAKTTQKNAPIARKWHSGVWIGKGMLIWGGISENSTLATGAVYSPAKDQWQEITESLEPRVFHSTIWTGKELLVWGGGSYDGPIYKKLVTSRNPGMRYDLHSNTWSYLSSAEAPKAPRWGHQAVWTGTEMIVWGGMDDVGFLSTGGRYNPTEDTWRKISTVNAPSARSSFTSIWNGTKMMIFGGGNESYLNEVYMYDPTADTWEKLEWPAFLERRIAAYGVWTGTNFFIWGGSDENRYFYDGALFRP